jgi:putative flippase GtrA
MWIWAAMYDLKAHVLYGKTYHLVTGPARVAIVLAVTVITAASFFLNAVFAFAIAKPGPPLIRPAFRQARSHLAVVLGSGAVVGLCLGLSTVVLIHWGLWWFALTLSIVIGVMMVSYVAVPSRLIGVKAARSGYSKRDKLTASAVGGVIGAVVCTPPYLLGRVGLLMLGSRALLIPGIVVFLTGLTLQAGTTSAVKAVKLGAKLVSGRQPAAGDRLPADDTPPTPGRCPRRRLNGFRAFLPGQMETPRRLREWLWPAGRARWRHPDGVGGPRREEPSPISPAEPDYFLEATYK